MKSFLLLLKCNLLKILKGGKNKAGRGIATLGVFAILGVVMIIYSSTFTYLFASTLPSESKYLTISIMVFTYCIFTLFTSIGTSKILFGATDYDMLMSLPIKPSVIILSKLAYTYFIALLSAIVWLLPSAIIYMIVCESSPIMLLSALLVVIFIPILPLIIGLILGTVYNIFMSKIKRKNLVGIILGGGFLTLYFCILLGKGGNLENEELLVLSLLNIGSSLGVFNFIAKAFLGDFILLALVIITLVALGGLYLFILGKYYKKVNDLITEKITGSKYDISKTKTNSTLKALVVKEIKVFFSNSTIVLNSSVGSIMTVVLGAVFLARGGLSGLFEGIATAEELAEMMQAFSIIAKNFFPYATFFFLSTSAFTAFSVSLEGKNLWFIKSLPISAKDWVNAKLIMHLILTLPAGVIGSVLFTIGFGGSWYDIIISVLMTTLFCLVDALFGLAVNLRVNRFDWTSHTEIVKQGASLSITMLVSMLSLIPICILQFVLGAISPYLGFAIVGLILLVLIFIAQKIAYTGVEQRLLKM